MMSDYAMVTTVRREFSPRLPSALISLVLEFANWANVERKRAWLGEFRLFVRELEVNLRSNNSIGYQANRVRLGVGLRGDPSLQGYFEDQYWADVKSDVDLQMEPDYTSCMYPSALFLNGTTYVIRRRETWRAKLRHLQDMGRIPRALKSHAILAAYPGGPLHRRTEHCSSLCRTTSGPRRRRGVR